MTNRPYKAATWVPNIDEIRNRIDAATMGPWRTTSGGVVAPVSIDGPHGDVDNVASYGGVLIGESMVRDNAEFVAHSRADVPVLICAIDWLTDVINQHGQQMAAIGAVLTDDQATRLHEQGVLRWDQLTQIRHQVVSE